MVKKSTHEWSADATKGGVWLKEENEQFPSEVDKGGIQIKSGQNSVIGTNEII